MLYLVGDPTLCETQSVHYSLLQSLDSILHADFFLCEDGQENCEGTNRKGCWDSVAFQRLHYLPECVLRQGYSEGPMSEERPDFLEFSPGSKICWVSGYECDLCFPYQIHF